MSSARHSSQNVLRFVPRIEGLEDRTVPAGNVQAVVFDHVLYVTGDADANQIWIAGAGTNGVVIRSLDGTTTINGQTTLFVGGIKKGYHITMGAGDDTLLVTSTRSNGGLNVDMGDGNDVLGISDAGHTKETVLAGGAGDDAIILHASNFARPVYLNTGTGDDQVITALVRAGSFVLGNPGGSDYFSNQGSALGATAVAGFLDGMRPAAGATVPPAASPPADTTPPVATVSSSAPALTNTAPIPFVVSFSEDVSGFTATGVLVANGTVTAFSQVDARTFNISVTPTSQGAVSATVAAGAARDAAGNVNAASNTLAVTFDSLAPAVTINPLTTNSATPTITGTVDDPSATVQVTVNGQTYTATVSGSTWSVAVPTALTEGTYAVTATAADPAGNSASASLPTGLVIDLTAPTFTFSAAPTGPTNANLVTVTITFNEDVTGFDDSGVTVGNGTKSNFQTVTPGRVFSIDVTPDQQGDVTVTIAAGAAQDAAGGLSAAGSFTFVYDTTLPTVTVSPNGNGAVTGTSSDTGSGVQTVQISIFDGTSYYSGPTTGFDSSTEVFLSAGTTDGFAAWTYSIASTGTFTVNAKVTDNAGNVSTVAQTVTLTADTTLPVATIAAVEPDPTNATTIHLSITFDEDVTGFDATDLVGAVTNGTASNLQSTDARHYTFEIVPTADGPVTFTLPAGAVTDLSGNGNALTTFVITSDRTAPVAAFVSSQPDPTNATAVVVSIDFGEAVTGFTDAGVTVGNGTFTFAMTDAQHYTVTVTPTSDGPVTVAVSAGTATDTAGNTNPFASFTFVYDATAPTVAIDPPAAGVVTGTASDATAGVASVEVSVFDPVAMMYLSSTGFDSATEVFLPATDTGTGFSSWELGTVPPGTYDVTARATDAAGNAATTLGSVTVV